MFQCKLLMYPLILFFFFIFNVFGQHLGGRGNQSEDLPLGVLQTMLDGFYQNNANSGFSGSVLVSYENRIIYKNSFGYQDKLAGIPFDINTPSQLASTSKPFTAMAIMMLVEKKLIKLNDLVKTYLPGFPYPDISIQMLLSHRSGMPDYIHWSRKYWTSKAFLDNDQLLSLIANIKPSLAFPPNTRFKYCNTNYAILALIIERVSGERFESFLKKHIFDPLEMEHTFVFNPNKHYNLAKSYRANFSLFENNYQDGVYGDKGIYSTVNDLFKWHRALQDFKLLRPETLANTYEPISYVKDGLRYYGLGWRLVYHPDGTRIVYHNGWWHGNNTVFYRYIDDDFTIIILGNRFNRKIYKQAKTIYQIVSSLLKLKTPSFVEEETY